MPRILTAAAAVAVALAALAGCSAPSRPEVVLYTSVDQPYAEPLLKAFEAERGVHVRTVFDVEAAKSTGLANRLLAEKGAPRADVFWSSEVAHVLRLEAAGVLAPHRPGTAGDVDPAYRDPGGFWTGVGLRARVLLVNTRRVPADREPKTLEALASPVWKPGEVGIANPLFGTSATHMAALYAAWGPERARAYFAALSASGARVLDGNSVVRDLVARGELAVGLTDTDDAQVALDLGAPVKVVYPDEGDGGTFFIPSTVAVVAGGPHPESGRLLADFLVSADSERALTRANFFCASVRRPPPGMRVGWEELARAFERSRADASALFLK